MKIDSDGLFHVDYVFFKRDLSVHNPLQLFEDLILTFASRAQLLKELHACRHGIILSRV
jgi:hypothetical protein